MIESAESRNLCDRKEELLNLLIVEKNPHGEKNKKMKERKKNKVKGLQHKSLLFNVTSTLNNMKNDDSIKNWSVQQKNQFDDKNDDRKVNVVNQKFKEITDDFKLKTDNYVLSLGRSNDYGIVDHDGSNSTESMYHKRVLISKVDIEKKKSFLNDSDNHDDGIYSHVENDNDISTSSNCTIKMNNCSHDAGKRSPIIGLDLRYIMAPMVNQSGTY